MPTLNWIGKEAVVNHHHQVPFRLLNDVPDLACGEPGAGNLIVEGDNLEALKALLPYYAGQVKCIYIDPPYNTGNEGWVYNDNVRSPIIGEWLGKTVGKEGETLDRHDRWLCMMYPRLALLREFLREDGILLITIDDAEVESAIVLGNEIFGRNNNRATIIWQHSVQPKGYSGKISIHHNYLLAFAKSEAFTFRDIPRKEEHNANYSNPDNDPNGPWRSGDVRNALYRPNLIYDLVTPSGKIIKPPTKGWRWSKETMTERIRTGEIVFRADETRIVRKIYLNNQEGRAPESIWFGEDVGTTRDANQELKDIFTHSPFDTPKPTSLLERILQICTNPGDLVLDSFAGSGTTGHAVLKMNAVEAASRRLELEGKTQDASSTGSGTTGHAVLKANAVEAASRRLENEGKTQDASSTVNYFDPSESVAHLTGNLPHWRQDGATYFVTFRTADSMPQAKLKQWLDERNEWMEEHPEPHTSAERQEYTKLFPQRFQKWLDEGYGPCHLARPDVKAIVENALSHFDGTRYRLGEYVVMPNHVHVLVSPLGEHVLSDILQALKSFTAKEINRLIGETGHFWQKESFDHIVRSPEQMERIKEYIRDNPKAVEAASRRFGAKTQDASSTTRRFILVEMEPEIAPKITAERVRRVAEGYKNAKGEKVAGLGGGFRYCRLGEPLFDADRQIRPSVTFGELARHVYFPE
ncbi:MAG: transposase, partial [Terrimicrobiaceae bacterium]|nr:transposase [Terrimicrobiaceae bacterium]